VNRTDQYSIALRIVRIAGVHDAAGLRLDHPEHTDRHGHVKFLKPFGFPVKERALIEKACNDILVAQGNVKYRRHSGMVEYSCRQN
jgi:hypothetical protein